MNVELAAKALELAKANPERFDMTSFSTGWINREGPVTKEGLDFTPPCGTTACYAGWVSYVAAPVGAKIEGGTIWEPGKYGQHVSDYARKALGITDEQESFLFYFPEDLGELDKAVSFLIANPDATRDDLMLAVAE